MSAIDQAIYQRPAQQLPAGQTLHLYLDRANGIQLVQGTAQMVTHEWVAERCLAMTQRLDAGAAYQPAASGWVFLQALPGDTVQFCVVRQQGFVYQYLEPYIARFVKLFGLLRPA